jgi:hypothetical protein
MLCWECGAEMRLVQVVEDTTMLVSGYEHHTWQCSSCSTIERRMTFTRQKTPTPRVTIEPSHTMPAKPAQTVPVEPTQIVPMKPAPTAPVETAVPVEANQTVAVETTQTVPVQPTIQNRQPAWAKTLEKLHTLKGRATTPREAADEAERRAQ